jgi:hypothetical protein
MMKRTNPNEPTRNRYNPNPNRATHHLPMARCRSKTRHVAIACFGMVGYCVTPLTFPTCITKELT